MICDDETRRKQLRESGTLNGIDYVEVVTAPPADNQLVLRVYFIPKTTPEGQGSLSNLLDALQGTTDNVSVRGGERVKHIRVTEVNRVDDHLEIRVHEPGDFSTYTLVISSTALDPAYSQVDFSFKAGCPSRFDCEPRSIPAAQEGDEPLIDYMAKDYDSFRQALLDLISSRIPDWKERHEADLGIALVELLAYAGDQLSYYQDAVASEAYLETARQRISVRRHARLIDYNMHDGSSARAFIHLSLDKGTPEGTLPFVLPRGTQVLTRVDRPLGSETPPHGPVISGDYVDQAVEAADVVFETITEGRLHSSLNEIKIHTWGNRACCLQPGTTTVDLVGDLSDFLRKGDFLLFEEVKGVRPGLVADPNHRQVVRLTGVESMRDPLLDVSLTQVSWDSTDRLVWPLCISLSDQETVSVARGNIVLADHGRRVTDEEHPGPREPVHPALWRAYRLRLDKRPLSFRVPLQEDETTPTPVRDLLIVDATKAEPKVQLRIASDTTTTMWNSVSPHLLYSWPSDENFVVETDNEGRAVLRFGDGNFGKAPPVGPDVKVFATYRVGVGMPGNVGAESLVHVVKRKEDGWPKITGVRNPLPGSGGIDPESIENVKQCAPAAFHSEQFRAVTEEDYVKAAEKHPEVAKAAATLRWTGSWHTVFLTIDPVGRTDIDDELEGRIRSWVTRYIQAGYDLEIDPPAFVPLNLEIEVCVAHDYFRGDVEEALLLAFGNQRLPRGGVGFFHADNFTFGQPLYLSQIYAAVEEVEGVDSAVVKRLARLHESDPEPDRPATTLNIDRGYIPMGRLEVVRLDNDPNFPERGTLRFIMRGGR